MTNLDKIIELIDEEMSNEELEQWEIDTKLFMSLFPLFDCMSRIGQETTIDTLLMYLDLEKEE